MSQTKKTQPVVFRRSRTKNIDILFWYVDEKNKQCTEKQCHFMATCVDMLRTLDLRVGFENSILDPLGESFSKRLPLHEGWKNLGRKNICWKWCVLKMAANPIFSFTYKLTSGFLHYCTSHVFSLLPSVPFIPIQHIRILVSYLRFHNLPDALYKLLQSDKEETGQSWNGSGAGCNVSRFQILVNASKACTFWYLASISFDLYRI